MKDQKRVVQLLKEAGIPKNEWLGVVLAAQMMESDPDGMWSMLDDYGWHMSYEDVEELVEAVQ